MATSAELPDRQLFDKGVIWPDAALGFLFPHRLICTTLHTYPGVYGAMTGQKLPDRILADLDRAEDAIHDE